MAHKFFRNGFWFIKTELFSNHNAKLTFKVFGIQPAHSWERLWLLLRFWALLMVCFGINLRTRHSTDCSEGKAENQTPDHSYSSENFELSLPVRKRKRKKKSANRAKECLPRDTLEHMQQTRDTSQLQGLQPLSGCNFCGFCWV